MKTTVMSALCAIILLVGCTKKEPPAIKKTAAPAPVETTAEYGQEIILAKPMKVSGSAILLPVATRICIAKDASEITVVLPKGFSYSVDGVASRGAPVIFATYHCLCSGGGACQVMFAEELGFGCIHSNCSGGCTGEFTYKGYSVNRVINLSDTKDELFSKPEVLKAVETIYENESIAEPYNRETLYGVSFYIVRDEKAFLAKASCNCEGTKACTLKVKELSFNKAPGQSFKIYYCDGPCNGCELTVN